MQLYKQIEYLRCQTHPNKSHTRQMIDSNQDLNQQIKVAKPDLFYGERKRLQMFNS